MITSKPMSCGELQLNYDSSPMMIGGFKQLIFNDRCNLLFTYTQANINNPLCKYIDYNELKKFMKDEGKIELSLPDADFDSIMYKDLQIQMDSQPLYLEKIKLIMSHFKTVTNCDKINIFYYPRDNIALLNYFIALNNIDCQINLEFLPYGNDNILGNVNRVGVPNNCKYYIDPDYMDLNPDSKKIYFSTNSGLSYSYFILPLKQPYGFGVTSNALLSTLNEAFSLALPHIEIEFKLDDTDPRPSYRAFPLILTAKGFDTDLTNLRFKVQDENVACFLKSESPYSLRITGPHQGDTEGEIKFSNILYGCGSTDYKVYWFSYVTFMHEFCHVLGMVHTHQLNVPNNPCTTDGWVQSIRDRGDFFTNYARLNDLRIDKEWDKNSLMNYKVTHDTNTDVPVDNYIYANFKLSLTDLKQLRSYYKSSILQISNLHENPFSFPIIESCGNTEISYYHTPSAKGGFQQLIYDDKCNLLFTYEQANIDNPLCDYMDTDTLKKYMIFTGKKELSLPGADLDGAMYNDLQIQLESQALYLEKIKLIIAYFKNVTGCDRINIFYCPRDDVDYLNKFVAANSIDCKINLSFLPNDNDSMGSVDFSGVSPSSFYYINSGNNDPDYGRLYYSLDSENSYSSIKLPIKNFGNGIKSMIIIGILQLFFETIFPSPTFRVTVERDDTDPLPEYRSFYVNLTIKGRKTDLEGIRFGVRQDMLCFLSDESPYFLEITGQDDDAIGKISFLTPLYSCGSNDYKIYWFSYPTIMHEFCHVLGMKHTHQVDTSDNPCTMDGWTQEMRDNPRFTPNYARVPDLRIDQSWDKNSLMNYMITHEENTNIPENDRVHRNFRLSLTDLKQLRSYYKYSDVISSNEYTRPRVSRSSKFKISKNYKLHQCPECLDNDTAFTYVNPVTSQKITSKTIIVIVIVSFIVIVGIIIFTVYLAKKYRSHNY